MLQLTQAKAAIDSTGDQRTFHWKMAPELRLKAGTGMRTLEKARRCEKDGEEGGRGHSWTTNGVSAIPSSSSDRAAMLSPRSAEDTGDQEQLT